VQAAPIGDRVYISGCDFGILKVPVVDLWDSAERTRVVGEVSGDGSADQGLCGSFFSHSSAAAGKCRG
jgi:hypothetical protein